MMRLAQVATNLIVILLASIALYLVLFSSHSLKIILAQSSGFTDSCGGCCNGCEQGAPMSGAPNHGDVPPGGLSPDNPAGNYWDGTCGCMIGWNPGGDITGDDDGGGTTTGPAPSCTVDLVPASSTV